MILGITPAVLTGASVVMLAVALWRRRDHPIDRFLPSRGSAHVRAQPTLLRLLERLGRLDLLRRLADRSFVRRRLALAGDRTDIEVFLGSKLALAAGAGLTVLLLTPSIPSIAVVIPLAVAAGFRAPDFVLARRARRRQEELTGHVADLVEVLVATTEAGLSPAVALRRSVEVLRGPLGDELVMVIREIDLGAPWRESLTRLVERTDSPPLRRLVATLTRSQRLGASVGSGLRSLAGDVRAERRARAEEAARRAPVKMLFPLVFLILPAFLLLTVGPAVLATLRSLH
jgi:tight adherence protein C